jgi:putative ABC transport system ATP-binding protein
VTSFSGVEGVLEFNDVTFSSGGKRIVDSVSFEIQEGEKVCLTGPSGSGKSTILKLVMGIILPTNGQIIVGGDPLSADSLIQIRQQIAYIDQQAVLGAETGRKSLLLPYSFKANKDNMPDENHIVAALKATGLDSSVLDRESKLLSGGERQRLALARALLLNKKIFVFDEITSSLDGENRRKLSRLILDLPATVFAVTHDEEFITAYDRVFTIDNGSLSAGF